MCIGLLIGGNCTKVLEQVQIVASESGDHYAYRPRLGWCIIGPIINDHSKGSVSCYRVAVRNASTSQVAPHHFGIKDSIKDITLEEKFKTMYKKRF